MKSLPKVPHRKVLVDWVTDTLQRALVDGHFEPGAKLDQDAIAEELGISRTPIREALNRLDNDGVVEIRPHHGAFVRQVCPKEVDEVYEMRCLLEAEVVRVVTPVIPESVLDQLESSLIEAQAQFDSGDAAELFESDLHFHDTLADFARNRLLKEALKNLSYRVSAVRRFAGSVPGSHVGESIEEHLVIIRAIRCRDARRAVELMTAHLTESSARVKSLLAERES